MVGRASDVLFFAFASQHGISCGLQMMETPISRAAHNGHLHTVRFLAEKGADVNCLDLVSNPLCKAQTPTITKNHLHQQQHSWSSSTLLLQVARQRRYNSLTCTNMGTCQGGQHAAPLGLHAGTRRDCQVPFAAQCRPWHPQQAGQDPNRPLSALLERCLPVHTAGEEIAA